MVRNTNKTTTMLRFVIITLLAISMMVLLIPSSVTAQSGEDFNAIYERVSLSVVSISVIASNPTMAGLDQTMVSGGTGFVLDNDGHIMTNNHVVEGAVDIEISFVDGTLASADVVGLDPNSDLAVLQANLPEADLAELQPVTFGDSEAIEVGQTVLAIGSPFGKRWTLTSGIISATDRSIPSLANFSIGNVIQTDAAINPGNSGGPLLNLDGQVIGVNSQIVSGSGSSSGVGFAVPSNLAVRVGAALMAEGTVNYSYLGVSGVDMYLPLMEAFGLPNDTQGLVVLEAVPGGPASNAGLQSAQLGGDGNNPRAVPQSVDVITAIDGEPIAGISELIGYLASETTPGDTVTLDVLRLDNGTYEEMRLDVTVTGRPPNP